MIYMGIDGSTTSTGIGVFNNEELMFYTCIKPKSKNWQERLRILACELDKVFKSYPIEICYIEDVPLKDGKITIKKLSAVRGIVIALCGLYNVELVSEGVSDWRKNAGFFDGTKDGMKRDVMKEKAVNEVKTLFNIEVNDDIAEGILVAYRTRYPKPPKFGKRAKGVAK